MPSITIDDNDDRITYTGKWEILHGTTGKDYEGTTHSTWEYDASATIPFEGTGIRVFITLPGANEKVLSTQFGLDTRTPVGRWRTTDYGWPKFGEELYYSGVLPRGKHTLTVLNKGEDNDIDLRIDRVVIEDEEVAVPMAAPAGGAVSPPASTQSVTETITLQLPATVTRSPTTISVTTTSTTTATTVIQFFNSGSDARLASSITGADVTPDGIQGPSSTSSPISSGAVIGATGSTHPPTGVLIGAGVGGALALTILVAICILIRRRNRPHKVISEDMVYSQQRSIDPFTNPPSSQRHSYHYTQAQHMQQSQPRTSEHIISTHDYPTAYPETRSTTDVYTVSSPTNDMTSVSEYTSSDRPRIVAPPPSRAELRNPFGDNEYPAMTEKEALGASYSAQDQNQSGQNAILDSESRPPSYQPLS